MWVKAWETHFTKWGLHFDSNKCPASYFFAMKFYILDGLDGEFVKLILQFPFWEGELHQVVLCALKLGIEVTANAVPVWRT